MNLFLATCFGAFFLYILSLTKCLRNKCHSKGFVIVLCGVILRAKRDFQCVESVLKLQKRIAATLDKYILLLVVVVVVIVVVL